MHRAPPPKLIVITDWSLGEERLLRALEDVATLGARVGIQQRHPEASAEEFLREARRVQELCTRHGVPFFVNGRIEVALELGAHLHLPASGMLPTDARAQLPADRWISVAVHDVEEAKRAVGADFALVSPVFGAGSKPADTRPPLMPAGFRSIAGALPCRAYALGGINARNCRALPVDWTDGAAVVSSVLRAESPREEAERLVRGLRSQGAS